MTFRKRVYTLKVHCERVIIESTSGVLSDTFLCFHEDEGFLFARNGSVEHFEVPEPKKEGQAATPGETESLNSNIEYKE